MTNQSGQTLIETIMAIFILTTGLASGLALAIYSFGASSDIAEKITATGLAREGIETVRRMRDSNWLAGTLIPDGVCSAGQQCYPTWLTGPPYDITGSASPGLEYRLMFDENSSTNKLVLATANSGSDFRLYQHAAGSLNHTTSGGSPSNFFRKITIIYDDISAPYSATSPKVLVRSSVWWWGKTCPQTTYLNLPSDTTCKVITEENLTNWKNY